MTHFNFHARHCSRLLASRVRSPRRGPAAACEPRSGRAVRPRRGFGRRTCARHACRRVPLRCPACHGHATHLAALPRSRRLESRAAARPAALGAERRCFAALRRCRGLLPPSVPSLLPPLPARCARRRSRPCAHGPRQPAKPTEARRLCQRPPWQSASLRHACYPHPAALPRLAAFSSRPGTRAMPRPPTPPHLQIRDTRGLTLPIVATRGSIRKFPSRPTPRRTTTEPPSRPIWGFPRRRPNHRRNRNPRGACFDRFFSIQLLGLVDLD